MDHQNINNIVYDQSPNTYTQPQPPAPSPTQLDGSPATPEVINISVPPPPPTFSTHSARGGPAQAQYFVPTTTSTTPSLARG